MKIVSIILRVIVGLVFVVSAIAKLYPVEPFEVVFVDLGVSNWLFAPFIARTVIVFELFIGLALLLNIWAKNVIYYLAQGSLILFTIYLFFLLLTQGNAVDCGCFGSWFELSPLLSIIKNVALFSFLFLIKKERYSNGLKWVVPLLLLIGAFVTVFSLNKVGFQNSQAKQLNENINLEGLPPLKTSHENVQFSNGKKVVIFLSIGCGHCKSLAYKLALLTKNQPSNVYLVVASLKEENLDPFFEETKLELPFIWMSDDTFFKYSGGKLPAIIYVDNGSLKKKWTGEFVDLEELERLFLY